MELCSLPLSSLIKRHKLNQDNTTDKYSSLMGMNTFMLQSLTAIASRWKVPRFRQLSQSSVSRRILWKNQAPIIGGKKANHRHGNGTSTRGFGHAESSF